MCLCLFVLCHSAAPEESENVVQSDETENGTPLNPLVETLSQTALVSRLTRTVDTTDFSSPGLIGCRFFYVNAAMKRMKAYHCRNPASTL